MGRLVPPLADLDPAGYIHTQTKREKGRGLELQGRHRAQGGRQH